MRRKEFEIKDTGDIESFLCDQKSGILSLSEPDGQPYGVPLNYAYINGSIVFHSAKDGKKADIIRGGSKAQFTVYKEYAVIPSYFTSEHDACNATQFFASVMLYGELYEVHDPAEKARALNAIMDQVQGAGRYTPMAADDDHYLPMLKHTAVFSLTAETITAKFKAGQNLKDDAAELIMGKLVERGMPVDIETVELMKRYRPVKK